MFGVSLVDSRFVWLAGDFILLAPSHQELEKDLLQFIDLIVSLGPLYARIFLFIIWVWWICIVRRLLLFVFLWIFLCLIFFSNEQWCVGELLCYFIDHVNVFACVQTLLNSFRPSILSLKLFRLSLSALLEVLIFFVAIGKVGICFNLLNYCLFLVLVRCLLQFLREFRQIEDRFDYSTRKHENDAGNQDKRDC